MEFVSCFGVSFVNVVRDVTNNYQGAAFYAVLAFCLFCEMNFNIFGFVLEDLVYGDLKLGAKPFTLEFVKLNMDTYGSYMIHFLTLPVSVYLYGLPDFESRLGDTQLNSVHCEFLFRTFLAGGSMYFFAIDDIVQQKKSELKKDT